MYQFQVIFPIFVSQYCITTYVFMQQKTSMIFPRIESNCTRKITKRYFIFSNFSCNLINLPWIWCALETSQHCINDAQNHYKSLWLTGLHILQKASKKTIISSNLHKILKIQFLHCLFPIVIQFNQIWPQDFLIL